jgi:predicted membrane channel-forming protein YqfA (hemolysin III family)
MLAVIGETALYLLFGWLACAIVASYLSGRKGYTERAGLAAGLLLTVVGVLIFLVIPARAGSDWKVIGPFGRQKHDARPGSGTDRPGGDAPAQAE